jgi:hypothetical protein
MVVGGGVGDEEAHSSFFNPAPVKRLLCRKFATLIGTPLQDGFVGLVWAGRSTLEEGATPLGLVNRWFVIPG